MKMEKNSTVKETKICSVFNGCIKKGPIDLIAIDYWDGIYSDKDYIEMVVDNIGRYDYILVSDNSKGIKILTDYGLTVTLVYPDNSLRNEFLDIYIGIGEDDAVLGYYMNNWDKYINSLKAQENCKHIVLQSGQYLQDVL